MLITASPCPYGEYVIGENFCMQPATSHSTSSVGSNLRVSAASERVKLPNGEYVVGQRYCLRPTSASSVISIDSDISGRYGKNALRVSGMVPAICYTCTCTKFVSVSAELMMWCGMCQQS